MRTGGRARRCPSEETINELIVIRLTEPEEEVVGPPWWAIDKDRAAFLSIIIHLLIVLTLLLAPPLKKKAEVPLDQQPDPLGIIKMMQTPPDPGPIPVQFFPAPGPATKAPGKNPLPSDANRVAAGGDPKLPKAEKPKSVPLPGIQEMAPGRSGERQAAAPPKGEGGKDESSGEKKETAEALAQPRQAVPPGGRAKGLVGLPDSTIAGLTAEQVARAAKLSGQGGDDGGGWDREGGFVDSGPLSFDTANYDWGNYAAEMIRKIKRNWEVPSLAHYGMKGKLTIRFFILKDGRVQGATIIASSGIPPFDNASLQAILRSNPFRPLPADLGKDREGVTVTFLYNIRPEELSGRK
jgi:TonB family protein